MIIVITIANFFSLYKYYNLKIRAASACLLRLLRNAIEQGFLTRALHPTGARPKLVRKKVK